MSKMKGPAIFLAQFADAEAPFDTLPNITQWAGDLGYKGIQLPTWETGLIDLEKAADSKDYCDELKGICAGNGIEITEFRSARGAR
jgi:sugar phosphate isomerase/epimerase